MTTPQACGPVFNALQPGGQCGCVDVTQFFAKFSDEVMGSMPQHLRQVWGSH